MVTAALRSVFSQENAAGAVPQDRRANGRGPRGRTGVPPLPLAPLAQDLEHQTARAIKRGVETPHPRGRHLSERRLDHSPGGGGAA